MEPEPGFRRMVIPFGPFLSLAAGTGLYSLIGPLPRLTEYVMILAVAALSGLTMAIISYAPWLRPTPRIARPSPLNRWTRFRGAVAMGVWGAGAFGLAQLAVGVWNGIRFGLWPSPYVLLNGALTGFVIAVAFAIVLWVVYRRLPVEQLSAWRLGIWGGGAAALPALALVAVRSTWGVDLSLPHPMVEAMWVFFRMCLPGFLLAYGAVKLAQRPGRDPDPSLGRSGPGLAESSDRPPAIKR